MDKATRDRKYRAREFDLFFWPVMRGDLPFYGISRGDMVEYCGARWVKDPRGTGDQVFCHAFYVFYAD